MMLPFTLGNELLVGTFLFTVGYELYLKGKLAKAANPSK